MQVDMKVYHLEDIVVVKDADAEEQKEEEQKEDNRLIYFFNLFVIQKWMKI